MDIRIETCSNFVVSSSPADAPTPPRLALSQIRRIRRIVDAAVELAEEGGFDGVRLRDVAEASDVSLGTLYKYFRSKEDVLLFAVNEDGERLEAVIAARPPEGETPSECVAELFGRATRGFTRRPNFARAALRSIASGDESMAARQATFHLRTSRMVIAALHGEAPDVTRPLSEPFGSDSEQQIALVLEHVWFASLLGWASGLHPASQVSERMASTAALLLDKGRRSAMIRQN